MTGPSTRGSVSPDPVDEAAEHLYGVPFEDFVPERTGRPELRQAGEKDAAKEVQASCPSPARWRGRPTRWRVSTASSSTRCSMPPTTCARPRRGAVSGKGAGALRDGGRGPARRRSTLSSRAAKELRPAGRKPDRADARAPAHHADRSGHRRRRPRGARPGAAWSRTPRAPAHGAFMEGGDAPAAPAAAKPRRPSPLKNKSRGGRRRTVRPERDSSPSASSRFRAPLTPAARGRAARGARGAPVARARAGPRGARGRPRRQAARGRAAAAEDTREQADEANAELDTTREATGDARDQSPRLEEQLGTRKSASARTGSRSPSGSSIAIRRASCARPRTSSLR